MSENVYTPPPVTGYRALTQTEVDLMNKVKAQGQQLAALIAEVKEHIIKQRTAVRIEVAQAGEQLRLDWAEPERWAAIGRTHFQEGLMALTRAIAQPGSF